MRSVGQGTLRGFVSALRDTLHVMSIDGMTNPDECLLLLELASRVREGVIVEIGSYRGRSTIALAHGSRRGANAAVYAIEPHAEFQGVLGGRFGPQDKGAFLRNVGRSGLEHLIHLISLPSETAAGSWSGDIGLLCIDGDHRYEAVRADFEAWSPYLIRDGWIAFDDSTVSGLGPHRLVREIVEGGDYEIVEVVGKITVLKRRPSTEQ